MTHYLTIGDYLINLENYQVSDDSEEILPDLVAVWGALATPAAHADGQCLFPSFLEKVAVLAEGLLSRSDSGPWDDLASWRCLHDFCWMNGVVWNETLEEPEEFQRLAQRCRTRPPESQQMLTLWLQKRIELPRTWDT